MKVLLIGGGGREHALAWRLRRSPMLEALYATDANPGFGSDVISVDGDPVAAAQKHGVDFVVVGPEAPLADGLVDRLAEVGIGAFGPSARAAQLEASKAFSKSFMDRHRIPTAKWSVHDDLEAALAGVTGPCVVKADGLAAGKGVVVAQDIETARTAVQEAFAGRFGTAGHRVVIEELLEGPEVSVLAICDGERAVPMLPCRDHKRRFDGDAGPNTGGMGAICPPPGLPAGFVEQVHREVLMPTVEGMKAEGAPFRGVLYAGLMLTADGPKVLEFNVRFGDPECQPLMMMLDEDLLPLMLAASQGELPARDLVWHTGAACCVVMVAGAYPGAVPKGMPITGLPEDRDGQVVFYAGASEGGGQLCAAGGRVLGVTVRSADLVTARRVAYEMVSGISFETAAWRKDIGITGP